MSQFTVHTVLPASKMWYMKAFKGNLTLAELFRNYIQEYKGLCLDSEDKLGRAGQNPGHNNTGLSHQDEDKRGM